MPMLHSRNLDPHLSGLDFHVQHFWPRGRDRFDPRPPDKRRKDNPVVKVRINHGRWLADCPYCTGAQLADPLDHRFFCVDCLMEQGNGRWCEVEWPVAITANTIEAALAGRPTSAKNWEHWESVSFLLSENVMHGTGDESVKRGSLLDQHGQVSLPPDARDLPGQLPVPPGHLHGAPGRVHAPVFREDSDQ